MRDAASLPYVHWYHYSPSCVAFSPDGKRDGDSCETGSLWTYAVDYIEKKRPMLITYEMTKSILDNKYRHVLKTMLGRLRHEGYKLHIKLMRTHDHGIPQRRVRLWVVGCRHWRYEFKWPAKVPLKKTASMIIKKKIGRPMSPAEQVGSIDQRPPPAMAGETVLQCALSPGHRPQKGIDLHRHRLL